MSKAVQIRSVRRHRCPRGPRRPSGRTPAAGEVLVEVKAAGINPGEAIDPQGLVAGPLAHHVPVRTGQRLRGRRRRNRRRTSTISASATRCIGFSDKRASHARIRRRGLPRQLTAKPAEVPWEVAGALYVAGTTAYAAVRAVDVEAGRRGRRRGRGGRSRHDRSATGQARRGATVLGIAGPSNDEWLTRARRRSR